MPNPDYSLIEKLQRQAKSLTHLPVDGGGGGGDDGGMDTERRLTAIEALLPTLATKTDVAELRLATRADFNELHANVADIRTDIHKAITENSRWTHTATVGMFSAFVLGVAGLLFTIWNTSKSGPAPAPAAPAPIVIQIPAEPSAPPAPPSQRK